MTSSTEYASVTLTYDWDEAGHLRTAARAQSLWQDGVNSCVGFRCYHTLPTELSSSSMSNAYLYDGAGQRTWHSSNNTGSETYALEIFPSLVVSQTTWTGTDYVRSATNEVTYLVSGSSSVGRVLYDSANLLPAPKGNRLHVYLQLSDPKGSTSTTIDQASGEVVEQITYLAQGQTETDFRPTRWSQFREGYRYTGKEDDYDVGLVYYGARYYVPGVGRWASADPLTVHGLGADVNPYTFVRNSPFRYMDQTGLLGKEATDADIKLMGAMDDAAGPFDNAGLPIMTPVNAVGSIADVMAGDGSAGGSGVTPPTFTLPGSWVPEFPSAQNLMRFALGGVGGFVQGFTPFMSGVDTTRSSRSSPATQAGWGIGEMVGAFMQAQMGADIAGIGGAALVTGDVLGAAPAAAGVAVMASASAAELQGMMLLSEAVKRGGASSPSGSSSSSATRATNPSKAESKVWQQASPYKEGLRRNGDEIWDWDKLHNDIEVYDARGRHLGSRDPTSGEMYKPAVPGRRITL